MDKGAISRDDILKTIAEYEHMGAEAFLDTYEYGKATKYVILHAGKEYDSKAIAGVAHKHQHERPLANDELSGGVGRGQAVEWLKREGFTIGVTRNPKWTRDELILACDVVARNGWKELNAEDPRIAELSEYLQLLSAYPLEERASTYRNHNGCARKTSDIVSNRLGYEGKPTNGGQLDREVAADFTDRPAEMAQAAELLREGLRTGTLEPVAADDSQDDGEDEASAPEGRLLYRRHRTRERNRALRTKKIAAVLKAGGSLACQACGFDFEAVYGERGEGYIECHHVVPLHKAGEGTTKLSDLALICSNCHRMIHRSARWLTPSELRALVESRAQARAAALPAPRPSESSGASR
ncbi:HNH endonuclease [Actinacidiphila glaucinigra]|uniref:HNH endonuclease n=1 Tax=Actinacidiphila glaucinigra TaxID=235986 RepID=UPI00386D73A3